MADLKTTCELGNIKGCLFASKGSTGAVVLLALFGEKIGLSTKQRPDSFRNFLSHTKSVTESSKIQIGTVDPCYWLRKSVLQTD
jgi:hypothetical protein